MISFRDLAGETINVGDIFIVMSMDGVEDSKEYFVESRSDKEEEKNKRINISFLQNLEQPSMANKSPIRNNEQNRSLEEIYLDLQNVFKEHDLIALEEKCEDEKLASYIDRFPQPAYVRANFDRKKHRLCSTAADIYLEHLLDDDPNADLRSYRAVDILSDGSVLFRAISWLTGFEREEDVRQLRIRSLINAISNLDEYSKQDKDLKRGLRNTDIAHTSYWANLICEKDKVSFKVNISFCLNDVCLRKMDAPNIFTMLILISLSEHSFHMSFSRIFSFETLHLNSS